MSDYRTFLVPYDFSSHARAALLTATDLAKRLGADLHLIHVVQSPPYASGYAGIAGAATTPPVDMTGVRNDALRSLQEVADGIPEFSGKVEPHVVEGVGIADMICVSADRLQADLIVMGTHGRTGLTHVFLGSVAERTLRSTPCPVLTIRSSEDEQDE